MDSGVSGAVDLEQQTLGLTTMRNAEGGWFQSISGIVRGRRKIVWAAAGLIIALLAAGYLYHAAVGGRPEEITVHTANGAHSFTVEIADKSATRSKGLMGRKQLDVNAGMLFHYREPREMRMWMKDTPLSLDMIFIRREGTVHRIEARTQPFSEGLIHSGGEVVACLEVLAGTADRIGLKPGDRVDHRFFRRASRD